MDRKVRPFLYLLCFKYMLIVTSFLIYYTLLRPSTPHESVLHLTNYLKEKRPSGRDKLDILDSL